MKKHTSLDQKKDALIASKNTSAVTQRMQIVSLIKQHQSRSTPEFREYGIMQPAARIMELKERGYKIEKILETYIDATGKKHRGVARYYFANNPPAAIVEGDVA